MSVGKDAMNFLSSFNCPQLTFLHHGIIGIQWRARGRTKLKRSGLALFYKTKPHCLFSVCRRLLPPSVAVPASGHVDLSRRVF
jgi:hypothetical protein